VRGDEGGDRNQSKKMYNGPLPHMQKKQKIRLTEGGERLDTKRQGGQVLTEKNRMRDI